MNSTNHLMIFSQSEFVDRQVRKAMAQAAPTGPSALTRVWRALLRHA